MLEGQGRAQSGSDTTPSTNQGRAWIERGGVPHGKTLKVAHRGASAYAPENTIAAFRLAAQLGARAIELDVQLARDQQLVVCHDADVSRTTNGSGAINDLDLATLRTFDAGYHFSHETDGTPFRGQGLRIPTLSEVFAAIPSSLLVNVEVKATLRQPSDPTLRHLVVQTLASWLDDCADQGYRERILLSSFDWALIDAVREAALGVPTAYLIPPRVNLRDALDAAAGAGHAAIHPHESLITEQSRATLVEARKRGIAVIV
ncbi:MAG: glycerophosphodiester phosphodiesterase family protein, partial [Nitrolancea sp.]